LLLLSKQYATETLRMQQGLRGIFRFGMVPLMRLRPPYFWFDVAAFLMLVAAVVLMIGALYLILTTEIP
jgi:hypothetical protein